MQANILTLEQRREKQLLGIMYDVSRKLKFVRPHRAATRQADKIILDIDMAQCGIYAHSPCVIGCYLWNKLDAITQKSEHKLSYKARIKDLYRLQQNPDLWV